MSPIAASSPSAALAALRHATRARHDRIDRLMDLRRLGEPARYGRILQAFDAFVGPWERAVAAALPEACLPWLRQRSRHAFLRQDLRALGLPPARYEAPVPRLANAAAAWGSLYVMEGSALGGQVITRSLAHGGLDARRGAAYFHGWGEATGAMWREFRERLEEQLAGSERVQAACDGACRTFDALTALLESQLHERPALA